MSEYTFKPGRFKNIGKSDYTSETIDTNSSYIFGEDRDNKVITATPQMRCRQLGLKYDKRLAAYLKTRLHTVYIQYVGDNGAYLNHYRVDSKLDQAIKDFFSSYLKPTLLSKK